MNELYQRLMRAIPFRRAHDAPTSGLDARSLKTWIEGLPLANFSATAKQLLEKLRWTNQVRIAPLDRLQLLEQLRIPIGQCVATADAQILGSTFPLPAHKAELGTLTEMFEHELSLGYVEVLYDLCGPKESVPAFRGQQASLAALRALQHGGQCLQKSYQCYHAPLAGMWQLLHDTYRVIVDLGLHNRPADGPRFGGGTRPRNVYAHALMLSLVNPYSYTFRELPEIVAITRVLAPLCELAEAKPNAEQTDTLRLVDVCNDSAPGFIAEDDVGHEGQRPLLSIETSRVRSDVSAQIDAAPSSALSVELGARNGSPVQADIRLLKQLVESLTTDHSRSFERLESDQEIETVIGLHDLHSVLAGNEDFATFAQRVFGSGGLEEHEVMASWVHLGSEQPRIVRQRASALDQSLRGYRLHWQPNASGESVRAKVGEVVGLRAGREGIANWIVGSIRWLQINAEGHVEAGVEVLSRRALPVAVRLADTSGRSRPPVRGLMMAPLRSGDAGIYSSLLTPSLLTPNLVDRSLTALRVASPHDASRWWNDEGVRQLNATGMVDRSGSYVHFRLPSMRRVDAARHAEFSERAVGAD